MAGMWMGLGNILILVHVCRVGDSCGSIQTLYEAITNEVLTKVQELQQALQQRIAEQADQKTTYEGSNKNFTNAMINTGGGGRKKWFTLSELEAMKLMDRFVENKMDDYIQDGKVA